MQLRNAGAESEGICISKRDEILHGYGMKNIQDIVRKYDGIFRYKIYGEYLVCIISIYDIRGAEEE